MTEAQIQEKCVLWFDKTYPEMRLQLYANLQNPRSKQAGAMLVGQGLRDGVADLTFIYLDETNAPKILYIEMKTETGRQSPAQKRFQAKVESLGMEYRICRSLVEFQAVIFGALSEPKSEPLSAPLN